MSIRTASFAFLIGLSSGLPASSMPSSDDRGAELLAAEASGLMQGALAVRDLRERGRLWFLTALKLERIKAGFPRSSVAAELAFGRYESIDIVVVEREARAWATANASEAEVLRRAAPVVGSLPATGGTSASLVPNFGRGPVSGPSVTALLPSAPDPRAGEVAGRALTSVQLAERLKEAAIFIYIPGKAPGTFSVGSGFFISPTHIMTNTHVVEGSQRVVVANKTAGVRAARVLALGMSNDVGPDTAILQIEGWTSQAFLPFASGLTEGENIAIAAYPFKAADGIDRSFMNFRKLIAENRIPTAENIPNAKFDFGFLQSVFIDNASGIENAQLGIVSAPGSSGSAVVNRCGEVVAQAYSGTKTKLAIERSGTGFVATGQSMTFSFGISVRELTKFIISTGAPASIRKVACSG